MIAGALEYARAFVERLVMKDQGRRSKSFTRVLFIALFPFTLISMFINNTPLVAMLIPYCREIAYRLRIPVSKLMIPLSYSIVAGGVCTLIGTSTNLTVQALALKQNIDGITIFTPTPYAISFMLAGWFACRCVLLIAQVHS